MLALCRRIGNHSISGPKGMSRAAAAERVSARAQSRGHECLAAGGPAKGCQTPPAPARTLREQSLPKLVLPARSEAGEGGGASAREVGSGRGLGPPLEYVQMYFYWTV